MAKKRQAKVFDGYIRVSQVAGREGDSFISPSEQRAQIEKWANLRGVDIAVWHEDLDQTGGKLSRPGLDALMARIRAGETEGMVVARLDRLSRAGVADALRLVEEIHKRGAELVAVDLGIDPTTPFGEFGLTIMLALGRMERRRIAESWDAANRRAIERGVHFAARVPFGYTRGDDGRLLVNDDQAAVVVEVFERRAAKEPRWSIATWLNERYPRPDGHNWTSRNVATLIQNRAYLGEAFHGEHRNPDAHDPIVTPSLFEAANAVAGGSGRTTTTSRPPALLAGLIRCAGCRYAMRRTFTTYRSGARRLLYSCQRRHTGGVCPEPASVMAHMIEPLVAVNTLLLIGGARWQEEGAGGAGVREAEAAVERAESSRDTFIRDDELRKRLSRDAYLAEAERREAVVAAALDHLAEVRAAEEIADRRRQHVLISDWVEWDRERQADTLRTALDAVYVQKGRGNLDARVMLVWDGEDEFEKPRRGSGKRGIPGYRVQPIPWPASPDDPHYFDVPANAQAAGRPDALEAAMILGRAPSCRLSDRPETAEEFEARISRMDADELAQVVAELSSST